MHFDETLTRFLPAFLSFCTKPSRPRQGVSLRSRYLGLHRSGDNGAPYSWRTDGTEKRLSDVNVEFNFVTDNNNKLQWFSLFVLPLFSCPSRFGWALLSYSKHSSTPRPFNKKIRTIDESPGRHYSSSIQWRHMSPVAFLGINLDQEAQKLFVEKTEKESSKNAIVRRSHNLCAIWLWLRVNGRGIHINVDSFDRLSLASECENVISKMLLSGIT